MLVLRSCKADMSSPHPEANGFRWPSSGPVEAPDWDPTPRCGKGLHGLLWGHGDFSYLCWDDDAKWLVVEVDEIVDLGDKVKFPRGNVIYCGEYAKAVTIVSDGYIASGYASSLAASGQYSRLAASGHDSRLTASGDNSKLAASGNNSKLAASGYASSLAASGDGSIVCSVGFSSTASVGPNGCIALAWHDGQRSRLAVGYVGEHGIKPNVTYFVDTNGQFKELPNA